MSCQNPLKCTKGPSGPRGRPCQRKDHDNCDPRPCVNIATNGPENSRIYCPTCVTQLKLRSTYPCNSKHCIACGKINKAKYGERTKEGPVRATHCAECAKAVGYVLAGVTLCSFKYDDGNTCNAQAKVKSNEDAFCGTHTDDKDDCLRNNLCKELECTLFQVSEGYCTAHARERGISRKDNCVDCKDIRGTFKDGKDLLCRGCKDKRIKINPDLNILSTNAMCEVDNCHKRASFAATQNSKALRCKRCCLKDNYNDWVNVQTGCSVSYRRPPSSRKLAKDEKIRRQKLQHECYEDNCTKARAYGYASDGKRLVCSQHISKLEIRQNDPVTLMIKRRSCELKNCSNEAEWGLRDLETGHGIARRCKEHILEKDENIKVCKYCKNASASRNPEYLQNCARCFYRQNPDHPKVRNYKTKEQTFMQPLKRIYSEIILDKPIAGGCSTYRPDGLIDCLTHSVVIEIDEDQHAGYDLECERRRMMEIFKSLGYRPIVFIRFNPDAYILNSRRVKSVFTKSKAGEMKIRSKQELERRLEELISRTHFHVNNVPSKDVDIQYMFYTHNTK